MFKKIFAKKGKYNVLMIIGTIVIFAGLISVGFAFFSDTAHQSNKATSGCLQVTPTLKIDGQIGDRIQSPGWQSSATCVPARYTQVEYVQFSGNDGTDNGPYIDTGITPVGNITASIDFMVNNADDYQIPFGTDAPDFYLGVEGENNSILYLNRSASDPIHVSSGQRYKLSFNSTGAVYLNGSLVDNMQSSTPITSSEASILLGALNNAGTNPSNLMAGKVYGFSISKDGVTELNYIPVFDNQTGEYGMYDTVSGQFVGNSSSSGTITGPAVSSTDACSEPTGGLYAKVDYLQFSGNIFDTSETGTYIDTGVEGAGNLAVSLDYESDDQSNAPMVFGASSSGYFMSDIEGAARIYWMGDDYNSNEPECIGGADCMTMQDGERHQLSFDSKDVYWDGELVAHFTNNIVLLTNNVTIYLGALNNSGGPTNMFKGKVYSFRVSKDGVAKLNYTPVVNTETGECGMWDSVTNQFFGNDGDGTITCPSPAPDAPHFGSTTTGGDNKMPCNGQYQGDAGVAVQPNTIHNFSYTLTNTGTVNYQNYTGDTISAWLDGPYVPVDHLTFDGKEYIDSGVTQTTPNLDILTKYQFTNNPAQSYSMLFGARNGGNVSQALLVVNNYSQNMAVMQFGNLNPQIGTSVANLNLNTMHFVTNATSATATQTNVSTGATQTRNAAPTTANLPNMPISIFIGADNQGNNTPTSGQQFVGDMYSFQISSNGKPLRDMVPVYDSQSGQCGLLDKVSGQFFGNLGTGTIKCNYGASAQSPMKILLYPASTSSSVINSDIAAMDGGATTAPNAIATINGSTCSSVFMGIDAGITPVCQTGVLPNTQGAQTNVGSSQTYNYKFVVYLAPSFATSVFSNTKVYFGVSSAAQGIEATNWKQQIHPYMNAKTPKGNSPIITIAGNTQPFVGQIIPDNATVNPAKSQANLTNYLQGLVKATDTEDGACSFTSTSGCTITLVSDGGFDPNKVGKYELSYQAIDQDGNLVDTNVTVRVWNFTKISGRDNTALALGSNGSVWAWGANLNGQLGNGNTTSNSTPTQVSGLSNIVDIASNGGIGTDGASYAVAANGTVYSWGAATYGQLGNGTTSGNVLTPTAINITGLATGEKPVAVVAQNYSVGIVTNLGNVWTWGYNVNGKLGGAAATNQTTPMKVTQLTNIKQIGLGWFSGIALDNNGQAWTWGSNANGRLGIGNAAAVVGCRGGTASASDQCIPNTWSNQSGISSVAVGYWPTGVIKNDNSLWVWGGEDSAELGNGGTATDGSLTPVKILDNVRQADFFYDQSVACTLDGKVYGWGHAYEAPSLGNIGYNVDIVSPQWISIVPNCQQVVNMFRAVLVLSTDGTTVYGMGRNTTYGVLGNGTLVNSTTTAPTTWAFKPAAAL
ncbi:hypothetical protein FWF48_01195 [Candidatus Saccharibacteria bacterium]|nr:hypothetical protein [Candidatus Saccharibacteria bacterium]